MESAIRLTAEALAPATRPLHARVAEWMTRADARLQPGDGPVLTAGSTAALARALREGIDLAAEELRVEHEERHDLETAACAQLAAYRHLLDHVPVALLATDLAGHVRQANDRACRLLGTRSLAGALLVRFVALEERRVLRDALTAALRNPAMSTHELPLRLRLRHRGDVDVVATMSTGTDATGRGRLLYWAVREDERAAAGELL